MQGYYKKYMNIDWTKITPLLEPFKLYDWDLQDLDRMVDAALEKWVVKDEKDFKIYGIEQPVDIQIEDMDCNNPPTHLRRVIGYVDLWGCYDRPVVIDWKTAGTLDYKWEERLRQSWQGRMYAEALQASVVVYRGVTRDGKTKEILVEYDLADNQVRVRRYLNQMWQMRQALKDDLIWPQSKPFACGSYGCDCAFKKDCFLGNEPLQKLDIEPNFSYSGLERFALCPEKYRRSKLDEAKGEESDSTNMGKAFHLVMAEVYSQIYGISYDGRH